MTRGVASARTPAYGHPALVRATHWITSASFAALVLSGVAILLAHPRLYWGDEGAIGAPSLVDLPLPLVLTGQTGWGRSLHFLAAWVSVFTGAAYLAFGLRSGHFRSRLWPATDTLTGRALRASVADHLSTTRLTAAAARGYNPLQQLTYLIVVFGLAPVMVWTGLAMSPALTSAAPVLVTALGGQQSARTIHFFTAALLVLFVFVHLVMVWRAGFIDRVRAMTIGGATSQVGSPVSGGVESSGRRRLVTTGLAAAAGATGVVAVIRLASRYGLIPPDHGGVYGAGETMTYAAQRILTSGHSLAREFDRRQISRVIPVNGDPPETDAYLRLLENGFKDWRLTVDGLVERPMTFSLSELKALTARSQITQQACEEGWSFIAEWTGVPVSALLTLVGARPHARYVVFFPYDQFWDSLDMADAWHPQTLLAYEMNGSDLSPGHGAPVRLKVPRQLGYKNVKFLQRITLVETLDGIGQGLGSASPEIGYSWYAGI